MNYMRDHLHIL